MQEYENKQALINEIKKTSELFINELSTIAEADKDTYYEEIGKTPAQIISYQLGWMNLLMKWDQDEADQKEIFTPAEGYKWNKLGELYQSFYDCYENTSFTELQSIYREKVDAFLAWIMTFTDEEIFTAGSRKWAASTPSNWPVWKWIHINSVAPFKSFRALIRKWKKLNAL